jgi:universal stress protein A
MKWTTILCPIDFSEVSLSALRLATALRELFDARLILVYVVEPIVAPSDFTFGPMTSGDVEERLMERSRQSLEEVVASLEVPREKIQSRVEHGRASQEIVRVASEEKADVIVMGTHGYTGMAHVLLGSTAERVLRRASCPVLTVRAQNKGVAREG